MSEGRLTNEENEPATQRDLRGTATERQFLAAYDVYADALYRHIFFRVHDRELAQDLLADTFTRVWQYFSSGNTIDNTKAFLYRTAHNLVIDHYRSKKEESLDEMAEAGFDPADAAGDKAVSTAEVTQITAMLDKIPKAYRDVVAMRYVEELNPEEIGEILGESANTVSVRIHRGVAMVRKELGLHKEKEGDK